MLASTYNLGHQTDQKPPDLDSLCSALVCAYLRTHAHTPRTLHIPLSNLPRSDLALRTEMTAVLGQAGLEPSDLLTLSELPSQLRAEDTRWLLVDHNSLTGPLRKFSGQVIGCIDHHTDEDAVPRDAEPRVVEPCGSCMSLIVDETRDLWGKLADSGETTVVEQQSLARLALAPILIDTINLTADHKVREKDKTSVAFLEDKLVGTDYDRTAFFNKIDEVKSDISGLGFRDIFRKDYKEWTEGKVKLGISSVVQDLDYLIDEKADGSEEKFLSKMDEWAKERELDVASVMTASNRDGEFRRYLFVWGRSSGGSEAVKQFVDLAGTLQLEQYGGGRLDGDSGKRLAWRQHNLEASRKQVAPLLRDAMKKV